jgi:UDP-N-acetyl-D-galactosamine dehydrogenase
MAQSDLPINRGKVLVLGITFKENCPDIRNSKVVDVIQEMKSFGTVVDIYDPHANPEEVMHEYQLPMIESLDTKYDAIIASVSHDEFKDLDWKKITHDRTVVYDVKGFLDKSLITARL